MIHTKKIKHNVRNLFPDLREYFVRRLDVEFAYVFGSYGRGKEKMLSDVDIAIFLNEKISPRKYFDIKLEMIGDIASVLKTDEIDLVILNQADLSLAYQTVSSRTVIFERDPKIRVHFETRILDKYFDAEPIRLVRREYFKKQVKEGRIFG